MEMGPMHLWEQMTPIAKGVVVALVLLSIWSLYVSIDRLVVYRKAHKRRKYFFEIGHPGRLQHDEIRLKVLRNFLQRPGQIGGQRAADATA